MQLLNTLSNKCEGKYVFFVIGFICFLGIIETHFLLNSLSRGLELKYIITGSCVILSLTFIFTRPYLGIIIFFILSYFLSPEIFGKSKSLLVSLGGENLLHIVIITIIFCWLIWMIKNREFKFVVCRQNYLIIGFLLTIIISIIFAVDKSYFWIHFVGIIRVFFIYFAIINLITSKKHFIHLVWALILIFGIPSIEAVIEYLQHGTIYRRIGDPVWGDNNYFSQLLTMTIPLAFYLIFTSRSFLKNLILTILCLSMITTITITFSRSGFMGLLTVLTIILLKSKKKFYLLPIGISLVIGLIYLLPANYKDRIHSIITYQQDISAMRRVYAWEAGLNMVKQHPLTGVGLGNFEPLSKEYNPSLPDFLTAHNFLIHLAGECGIIGVILFLALIITSGRDLMYLKKRFRNTSEGKWIIPLADGIEVSFCGYIIACNFSSETYMLLLYVLIGLTVSLKQIAKREINKSEGDLND